MNDADLLNIFWEEANEHLETLNNSMLQVETGAAASGSAGYNALLKEMNRVAHSLKGAARAVGFSVIETVAHHMEEVFGAAREGTLSLTPDVADAIYDSLDLIQQIGQQDGDQSNVSADDMAAAVIANLEVIIGSESALDDAAAHDDPSPEGEYPQAGQPESSGNNRDEPDVAFEKPPQDDQSTLVMRPAEDSVRVTVSKLDRLMAQVTELFVAQMHSEERLKAISDLRALHARWQREWRDVRTAYIRLVRRLQAESEESSSELDTLLHFLEYNQRSLTQANQMLGKLAQDAAQDNMSLSTLADQLQDDVGGMRLVPFETITGMLQRLVRDLARDIGKRVRLDVFGAETEIDKAVLDSLKDPLMHLLRNAVDHGIEMPAAREQAGKSPVGRITLEVQQRGSEIVLTVSDDGYGIDADAVRRSAVARGLLSDKEAEALSDDDARTYIFYTGLSTLDSVTPISGRGLGMDIVRDRVENLRGRVGVQSVPGDGSTVMLNVPVSLTRIRCVILYAGEQKFAVPSAMVERMETVTRDAAFTAGGREMLTINEAPLPLVSLGAVLGIPGAPDGEAMRVVVLRATDRTVAFEVDDLEQEVELVLKPLGPELARARFVSGAALLGAGEVVVVLDVNDLVRQATGTALPVRRMAPAASSPTERRLRVLVVDDSITTRTLEKNILETAGFEVVVAVDGDEAMDIIPHDSFDVIVSDIEMPKMDGLELCTRLKSSQQYQDVPIILLTSLVKPEQREAGLRAGADAYLVKSRFDQQELLQTIQSVIH